MNLENIETIEQMANKAIEKRMFDDECDELEYKWGYTLGAHQALERVKNFLNGYGGINVSQNIIIEQISEFIDALEYNTDGE